jgi:SAM-dependent methyltransferase
MDGKDVLEMNNRNSWKPSKYVYKKGKLIASRDPSQVSIGSRLMVDLVAAIYDRNLRRHAKGKLLDLGCGGVPLYLAYNDFITENVCVDWGNTLHDNAHLDFECDLTQALPFRDGEFNTIILSDVLEHIPRPEYLWEEMSRILAIDGKIILNVPFYYWLHESPHDYYRYTEFALRRFVEYSGLRLDQIDAIGGAPEIMCDIFAKTVLRVPGVGRLLAMLAQWFTLIFVRTRLGRRISETTREAFPFGYFLVAAKPE